MLVELVASLGGGGGSVAPGECIIPADAETASVTLSAITAKIRLTGVIRCLLAYLRILHRLSTTNTKFSNQPRAQQLFLQEREGVRNICARYSPKPLFSHDFTALTLT